jgi:glycosyltransferase involved in cell wall biosynthesis
VFLPHKGHLKAIKIFEYLKKNYDLSAKLIFRGGKVNKAYYESVINEINKLDISFDIKIEEFDRTANLNQIYDQADVIMLLSTYEGFGLPVLEAQTRGIPVICSNIPVFQEITNLSAILVNPENLEQTCNRIYALSKDKKIYNYYSEQGIINSKRFSWITFASSFYNVYKNLN